MSNLIEFAKSELDIIGMKEDDLEISNRAMREHILKMVEVFSDEGHSGFSANYAVAILQKLLKFEPLSPLTGEDSEWNLISEDGEMTYQNKRCSHVFKSNGKAYDLNGKVFIQENGSAYTSADSRVDVTFPYTPKTEYAKVSE
jgi:hypothetical protein